MGARLFWGTAASIVIADQITKLLAEQLLAPRYVPHRVIGDVVRFTLAYNPGAAFSMSLGPYSRYIFGAFAIVALVVLWRLYRMTGTGGRAGDRTRIIALGLAWGGAAGNLIDRFRSPLGVVDFIDIGYRDIRFWTFNVADSAVTVGALILAWSLSREDHDQRLAEAAAQRNAALASGAPEPPQGLITVATGAPFPAGDGRDMTSTGDGNGVSALAREAADRNAVKGPDV